MVRAVLRSSTSELRRRTKYLLSVFQLAKLLPFQCLNPCSCFPACKVCSLRCGEAILEVSGGPSTASEWQHLCHVLWATAPHLKASVHKGVTAVQCCWCCPISSPPPAARGASMRCWRGCQAWSSVSGCLWAVCVHAEWQPRVGAALAFLCLEPAREFVFLGEFGCCSGAQLEA